MLDVFIKTLPFFALIGIGWLAARRGMFDAAATAALTRFVFYFALSAMLFRLAATLPLATIFDPAFVGAYLTATVAVYLLAMAVALSRSLSLAEAAVEAQCATSGNTGFLGVPLLTTLLGAAAEAPVMMVLTIDMVVFSSLITILITGSQEGLGRHALLAAARGLVRNPMVVAILAGFAWSAVGVPVTGPFDDLLRILGNAATPCALFAIGASLAGRSAERLAVALWLSFAKLILHPGAVAIMALLVFPVAPGPAGVMIATAALPVAGNVYILSAHYGVAPRRVSAAILVSTALSVVTVTAVIALILVRLPME